jgi:flagellar biosynthesis anti-sigma factor FlgM
MSIDPRIQITGEAQSEAVQSARTTDRQAAANKTPQVALGSGEDTVSISSTHQEVQSLKVSLANVPEVRTERVNSLRSQIQQGRYQPSSEKVADAIVAEHGKVGVTA